MTIRIRSCVSIGVLLSATLLAGAMLPLRAQAPDPAKDATVRISAPPQSLALDPFYKKYADVDGLPVVCSEKVSDEALRIAHDLVARMLAKRPDVHRALVRNKIRVAVMAPTEMTIDIPEHSDLNRAFPEVDWNKRARGLGATKVRPATSCGEENLLQLPGDRYRGESILIHEFGHTMLNMGVQEVDREFRKRLEAAYRAALDAGKWQKTYAATNPDEYWAEGVQSWFDANLTAVPANGIHNEIHTREGLRDYDPELAKLIAEVMPDTWRWEPPQRKTAAR